MCVCTCVKFLAVRVKKRLRAHCFSIRFSMRCMSPQQKAFAKMSYLVAIAPYNEWEFNIAIENHHF